MTTLTIKNAHIITPEESFDGWLQCSSGVIKAVGQGQAPDSDTVIDAQGGTVLAGFIDLHVHGAVGCDVMDASLDGLRQMSQFFAQHGVTSFLPTTLTDSHEQTTQALKTIREAMNTDLGGARVLGAHLEGPYLHIEQSGAQNKAYIRPIDRDELQKWLDLDVIRLISVAPELDDIAWLIETCLERSVTVSAAHTTASYEAMQQAIEQGLSHSTHTYNAMPKLHHRTPGGLAALLLAENVMCEVIADNVHVHPAMIKLLHQTVGIERIVLITDAMQATGMPDGQYNLGAYQVTVSEGQARLADGTLAGSTLTLNQGLHNFCQAIGASIVDSWQASSYNAAKVLNKAHHIGKIAVGYDADLVILDRNHPATVLVTIANGQIIYENQQKR